MPCVNRYYTGAIGKTWIFILISFQILNSPRCLPFMWTFIHDMLLIVFHSFFIIVHCWFHYIIQQFSLEYVVFESTLLNFYLRNPWLCRWAVWLISHSPILLMPGTSTLQLAGSICRRQWTQANQRWAVNRMWFQGTLGSGCTWSTEVQIWMPTCFIRDWIREGALWFWADSLIFHVVLQLAAASIRICSLDAALSKCVSRVLAALSSA